MARTFSSNFLSVINSDTINYFYLIQIELERTGASTQARNTYYYTSFERDITWNGQTWSGDGGLFEIDSPRFSSILDREAYTVVLQDKDNTLSDIFKQGVIGNDIKVRVGVLDSSGDPLVGVDGAGVSDIVFIYSGFIDSPSISVDWEVKTAKIEGTSPMADLDQIKLFMVSKDGMDQKAAADTSFDRIYDDNETHLAWGKI